MKQHGVIQVLDDLTRARPGDLIGYWRGGRPIFAMGGGAPKDDDGDDGGDDGDGDDSGGDGGDGDDLFDDSNSGGDGSDGGDGDGDGDETLSPAMQAAIAREANRIADRRINQVLQRRKKRRKDDDDGDDDRDDDRPRGKGKRKDDDDEDRDRRPAGPSRRDVREARMVYREQVADEVRFLGTEERDLMTTLATTTIRERLADGDDVDEAGEAAADLIQETVKKTRQFYQRQTIRALQRRGVLPDDFRLDKQTKKTGGTGGGGAGTGSGTDVPQTWQTGADRANKMFKDRQPQGS